MRSRQEKPGHRPPGVRLWHLAARATAVVGMACMVARWGLSWTICCVLSVGTIALTMTLLMGVTDLRKAGRITVVVTLALLGFCGIVGVLGWSGAALVGMLAVTALMWAPRPSRAPRRPAPAAEVSESQATRSPWSTSGLVTTASLADSEATPWSALSLPDDTALHALDDAELCRTWRRSFVALQHSRSVARCLEVVRLRQLCLDELDRRHPKQLQRWLDSGARAAGNPLPYLTRPLHDDAAQDG